jgi:hypothetical protein
MTKEKKIAERYETAISYAKKHFQELEQEIKSLEGLLETALYYLADRDDATVSEKDAYRRAYQLVWDDQWLDRIPSQYMERKDHDDWFDNYHDRMICNGDPIANADYKDLFYWELNDIRKGVTHEKNN